MRLTSLALRRYGSFADTTLDFDPAPGRINLVLAPNGTGKSVLRHAFGELLFGIGGQTPMGFRHGYGGMQLAASGVAPDGTPFSFVRRKGNKNTLTGPEEAPLDQGWLDRLLGRGDAKLLSQLYALDTERLRQGGRELLSSGGALADALLAAAGGLREASLLRRSLEEERDRLAPLRKTAQRPFYAALDRWSDARRQLNASLVRPQQWDERERALREALGSRDAANAAAGAAGEHLRRLERVRRVRPMLARRDAAAEWVAANPGAPILPPDLAQRLPEARGAAAAASQRLATAQTSLERLRAEIAALPADEDLLARGPELEALLAASGLAAQAQDGLPDAEAALAAALARAAGHLSGLGLAGAEDPASLVPSARLLAALRRLAAEHAAEGAASASLPERRAAQTARLQEAERALAALPAPGGGQRLEQLLREIRRGGEPVAQRAAARALAEAEARLAAALARLPLPLRDPDVLAAIDPPGLAALERLFAALSTARAGLERAADAVTRAQDVLAAARADRAALEAAGPPPTRAALASARDRREAGWDLVFRRLSGEAAPAAEAGYAHGRPLPLAYAEAVAAADAVADARLADAGRAARSEALDLSIAAGAASLDALREAEASAGEGCALAGRHWGAAIGTLGLDPAAGLAEAQRALSAREEGLAAAQAERLARAALAELQGWTEAAAARLADALGSSPAEASLPALLDRAEEAVRRQRAAEEERRLVLAAAEAARDALRGVAAEEEAAWERRARWREEWDTALAQLGENAGADPAAVAARLDLREALGTALGEAARLEADVAAWRRALDRFRAGHAQLRAALGLPPEPDALAGLRELDRRHRAEAARAEAREVLQRQHAAGAEAVREQQAALDKAAAALSEVIAAAGAPCAELAEQRIALAAERARQEGLRAAAEAELLENGDGLGLEALRAEASAQPPEGLEQALAGAEAERGRHAAEAQAQVAAATRLELEMRQLAGDDLAMRAASDEAAAAGEIGQTLDDALLMQVAAGLLDAALGAVQEGTDDALLRRIGDAFSGLTGGAYSGVAFREDERGTARLTLCPRGFPDEEAGVDQLSEGTRDQLFLALRMVAIEDHAASGTVLPFIGDDILQSFDDARAAAAFRTLLRLSGTAQVILLSHHEHLLQVLRDTLPASAFHLQRLEGAAA